MHWHQRSNLQIEINQKTKHNHFKNKYNNNKPKRKKKRGGGGYKNRTYMPDRGGSATGDGIDTLATNARKSSSTRSLCSINSGKYAPTKYLDCCS
jgi:hypothetical protein